MLHETFLLSDRYEDATLTTYVSYDPPELKMPPRPAMVVCPGGGYSMLSALVVELVLSAGFLLVIHGATDKFAPAGFAPIAIGLALTLIHLISIPVTNTSVNPARSTAVAIFQGGWALEQLWFFWVVPIVGGIIGGLIYRTLLEKRD